MNCKCLQSHILDCLKGGLTEEAKLTFQKLKDTLLHYSVKCGNAEMTQYLIDEGCDVNAQDDYGATPLMLAVKAENAKIVRLLVENSANIYITNCRGMSSLQIALDQFSPLVPNSHFILEMFFNIIKSDFSKGKLTLFLLNGKKKMKFASMIFGNAEIIRFLLKTGFSINTRELQSRYTALHCTIVMGRFENAKILIEQGANVDVVDKLGWSALSRYTYNFEDVDENSEVLKSFLRHSIKLSRPLRFVGSTELGSLLMLGKRKTVKTVLLSGVDIDLWIDSENESLLSLLVLNRNDGILDLFDELNITFDVNSCTSHGRTALMTAASFGWVEKVEFLLQRGANVNLTDYAGYSALSHTQIFQSSPDVEGNMAKVIELLLQHGADAQSFYSVRPFLLNSAYFCLSSKVVVAHLAMLGALESLTDLSRNLIQSESLHKNYFDLCTEQLDEMKNLKVYGEVTLFKLLAEREESVVAYARNRELISSWNGVMDTLSDIDVYYLNILQRKLTRLSDEAKLQGKVVLAIDALTGLCSDVYNVIVYQIIGYLDRPDLCNLCEIESSLR